MEQTEALDRLQTLRREDELAERLATIEQSVTRIEGMLAPVVQFFEQIKQHPMLKSFLG